MKLKSKYTLILIAFSLSICNAGTGALHAEDTDTGILCKGGCLPLDQPLEGQENTVCPFCDDSTNLEPLYKADSVTAQD